MSLPRSLVSVAGAFPHRPYQLTARTVKTATAPDRVIDELRQYDFEIISTNLPEEQENQLREAFAEE